MSTPDHLKPLGPLVSIILSQKAREVADLSRTLLMENQSFLISETPHDARRVANVLRHIAKTASDAALTFETTAKTGEAP